MAECVATPGRANASYWGYAHARGGSNMCEGEFEIGEA